MSKTLALKVHLYFVELDSGHYMPNSFVTKVFVETCIEGIKNPLKIEGEEMREILSYANRPGSNLIVNLDGKGPEL